MSVLQSFLLGGQGIASVERMLDGLTLQTATRQPDGLPFTIHGLLWHIELTQNLLLARVAGEEVAFPPSAEQWPAGPPSDEDWTDLLSRLRAGLYEASELAANPLALDEGDRELLEDITAHNAYHWGQVVVLRRLLGDWREEAAGQAPD